MNTLNKLNDGQCAVISSFGQTGAMRRRLEDLGFVPGTVVQCLRHAPSGNPVAYSVRGATIALRQGDAAQIGVSFI